MKAIPYISFNGNCDEAVSFYKSVLGGELQILRFTDMPEGEEFSVSEAWKNKIMHCALTFKDGNVIYFGDTFEGAVVTSGSHATIHLQVDSEERVHTIVKELSQGGTITMPSEKTFWGSVYGNLVDKFGVSWGVEFELKEQ